MAAIAGFFGQYVFGCDRAGLLAAQLPATTAEHAEARTRQQAHLRGELARIDTAEHGLITELETPADPADPAAQAYRARIRARYAELYAERTATEAKLTALQADTPQDDDLSLLDLLPVAAGLFADAPARIRETLLTAFDIQVLYRSDQHQVTIWATLTDDTPRTITALLDDPRTDSDTGTPTPGQDPVYHSAPAPIGGVLTLNDRSGCHGPADQVDGLLADAFYPPNYGGKRGRWDWSPALPRLLGVTCRCGEYIPGCSLSQPLTRRLEGKPVRQVDDTGQGGGHHGTQTRAIPWRRRCTTLRPRSYIRGYGARVCPDTGGTPDGYRRRGPAPMPGLYPSPACPGWTARMSRNSIIATMPLAMATGSVRNPRAGNRSR